MDVKILYPLYAELINHREREEPELFNYVCLHGRQLFWRLSRGSYEIMVAGWLPRGAVNDVTLGDRHILFRSRDYDAASIMFSRVLRELMTINADDFLDFGD